MKNKYKILTVCMANYCRSPVAKYLLQRRSNTHEIESAGIFQFDKSGMDIRSHNYLNDRYGEMPFHQPRKITQKMIIESDIVFAMDIKILLELNKNFKNYSEKFKLFSLKNKNIIINDPYKFNDKDYIEIMDKIDYVASKIEFDKY